MKPRWPIAKVSACSACSGQSAASGGAKAISAPADDAGPCRDRQRAGRAEPRHPAAPRPQHQRRLDDDGEGPEPADHARADALRPPVEHRVDVVDRVRGLARRHRQPRRRGRRARPAAGATRRARRGRRRRAAPPRRRDGWRRARRRAEPGPSTMIHSTGAAPEPRDRRAGRDVDRQERHRPRRAHRRIGEAVPEAAPAAPAPRRAAAAAPCRTTAASVATSSVPGAMRSRDAPGRRPPPPAPRPRSSAAGRRSGRPAPAAAVAPTIRARMASPR